MPAVLSEVLDRGVNRPMAALVGVLVYLAVVALAAMLVLEAAADRWRGELADRLVVQLPGSELPRVRDEQAERTLAILRALPGVVQAERVPDSRLAAVLTPLLGPLEPAPQPMPQPIPQSSVQPAPELLPLPVVIDVRLDAEESLPAAEGVRVRLVTEVPGASVEAGTAALAPALRMMRAIEMLSLLLVGVLGTALAGFVFFATRGLLAELAETIEVAHLLGADDRSILGALTRHALRAALLGGAAGFLPAVLTLLAFRRLAVGNAAAPAELMLAPGAWAAVLMLPLAAAAIAALTARLSARRALAGMP